MMSSRQPMTSCGVSPPSIDPWRCSARRRCHGTDRNPQQFGERARRVSSRIPRINFVPNSGRPTRPGRFATTPAGSAFSASTVLKIDIVPIVHRNRRRIDPRGILQQAHRRRIDVAEKYRISRRCHEYHGNRSASFSIRNPGLAGY